MKKFEDPIATHLIPLLGAMIKSRAFRLYGVLWVIVLVAIGAKLLGVI